LGKPKIMEIPNSRVSIQIQKEMLQAYDESPGYSRCGPGCANDDNSDKNTSIAMTSASIKFIKFIMPIMFTLRAATPQIPGGKN
jgi:hypothetical protein